MKQQKLPNYINCNTNTDNCQWYFHKLCEEKCPYALDIGGLGIGARVEPVKGLEDIIDLKGEY